MSHFNFVIAFVVDVQVACKYLQDESLEGDKLLEAIAQAVGVYYNSSGQAKCFNTSQQAVSFLGDEGWYFQVSNCRPSFCKCMEKLFTCSHSPILPFCRV